MIVTTSPLLIQRVTIRSGVQAGRTTVTSSTCSC